jgi:hypothetical protein
VFRFERFPEVGSPLRSYVSACELLLEGGSTAAKDVSSGRMMLRGITPVSTSLIYRPAKSQVFKEMT